MLIFAGERSIPAMGDVWIFKSNSIAHVPAHFDVVELAGELADELSGEFHVRYLTKNVKSYRLAVRGRASGGRTGNLIARSSLVRRNS